jgi:hypothetical protein
VNPTEYINGLRAAMKSNDLHAFVRDNSGITLRSSPHVGWFADMVTHEGEQTGLDREEWLAAEENVAFYAAWLDANMLRVTGKMA